ncbi:MAG: AraC family transcriptional regulator [Planctomycetota bacterium]
MADGFKDKHRQEANRFVDWNDHHSTYLDTKNANCIDFVRNRRQACCGSPPSGDLVLKMVSEGSISDYRGDFGFGTIRGNLIPVNDFILIPPNQANQGDGRGPFELTSAAIHWEKWETECGQLAGRPVPDFKIVHSRSNQDSTIRSLMMLGWQGSSGQPESEFYEEMIGSALIFRLLSLSNQIPSNTQDRLDRKKLALEDQSLRRALEYIHDHCGAGRIGSLSEIAKHCDLSRFQFCRRFAASTGYTPSDYLMRLRVEAARHRIADGASIANAAIKSGFSDQSHLTRFFTRIHGITPRQYRREIAGRKMP